MQVPVADDPLNRAYVWDGKVQEPNQPPFALHEEAKQLPRPGGLLRESQQFQQKPLAEKQSGKTPSWLVYDRKVTRGCAACIMVSVAQSQSTIAF
jgi:hypothetical protein